MRLRQRSFGRPDPAFRIQGPPWETVRAATGEQPKVDGAILSGSGEESTWKTGISDSKEFPRP